jgi:hypothetical protein
MEGKTVPIPSRSKGAHRRRRLARGIARWDLDRRSCAEPTRRIATLTLTIPEGDPGAAIGRVYDFWRRVRQQWLGTRYFCWLELQRRGAVHYHAVWVNPPHLKRVNLLAWVDRAWGRGRTQVRFSDGRHGLDREIRYAEKYAKKMGKKAYQQKYDAVPRELRTFMSQRLEIPGVQLDLHRDKDIWRYVPETQTSAPGAPGMTELHPAYLSYEGTLLHEASYEIRCSILDHRRAPRVRSPRWHTPPARGPMEKPP